MLKLDDPKLLRDRAYVNGRWVVAESGGIFGVFDPATGDAVGSVPDMGVVETRRAIEAAQDGWPGWRERTPAERANLLQRWHSLILEHQEDLARLITAEQGKVLAEATGEIRYGAAFLDWFAQEGRRVAGETLPGDVAGRRYLVLKEPVGVCAAVTPWNFPSAMITRKAAPALAAGCTMVVKPAEQTPLSALALAELADRAGIPPGVFNVVTSNNPADVGGELTANPIVRKLSFTGSTEVGKLLYAQCAGSVKKLTLELGGNAPFLVFDDADLDEAVEGALSSKYRNAGQTCVCANRFLVQEPVMGAFAEKLAERVKELRVGAGTDEATDQGPLIDKSGVEKVEELIDDALAKGATLVTGGKRHKLGRTFFEPTILAGVTPKMRITREETFGPVAPLVSFRDEAEAIRMANDTEYGLAAYFFTRDYARIFRVSEALEYGMVGVNAGVISTHTAPFGGMKQSGLGREGAKEGIEEYLETKYVCIAGVTG